MITLLVLHVVVGVGIVGFGTRLGRRALLLGAIPSAVTLGWLATQLGTLLDGGVVTESLGWAPRLGLSIDLRLDGFAALMVILVAGVGVAVFAYGVRYAEAIDHHVDTVDELAELSAEPAGDRRSPPSAN